MSVWSPVADISISTMSPWTPLSLPVDSCQAHWQLLVVLAVVVCLALSQSRPECWASRRDPQWEKGVDREVFQLPCPNGTILRCVLHSFSTGPSKTESPLPSVVTYSSTHLSLAFLLSSSYVPTSSLSFLRSLPNEPFVSQIPVLGSDLGGTQTKTSMTQCPAPWKVPINSTTQGSSSEPHNAEIIWTTILSVHPRMVHN